jgi:hypothetical protein
MHYRDNAKRGAASCQILVTGKQQETTGPKTRTRSGSARRKDQSASNQMQANSLTPGDLGFAICC